MIGKLIINAKNGLQSDYSHGRKVKDERDCKIVNVFLQATDPVGYLVVVWQMCLPSVHASLNSYI